MTIYPRCRKRSYIAFWWRLFGALCDCPVPYCYPMGPEGPREFVRLTAAKEPWPRMTERERQQPMPSLQAEIAALTERVRQLDNENQKFMREIAALAEQRDMWKASYGKTCELFHAKCAEIAAITERRDRWKADCEDVTTTLTNERRIWTRINADGATFAAERDQARARIAALTAQRDMWKASIDRLAGKVEALDDEREKLIEQRDIVTERLEELVAFAEQRDIATKALREVDAIAAQMGHSDTLGFNEAQERILEITNAALDVVDRGRVKDAASE